MDAELRTLAAVSASAAGALCYCYILVSPAFPGKLRLPAVLPAVFLFWCLPFSFSSVYLRTVSAFFLAWLSTFKLLLFAFRRGPLSDPNLSLPRFLALAALPVRIRPKSPPTFQISPQPLLSFAFKLSLLALIVSFYPERRWYPRPLVLLLYGIHVYLSLEVVLRLAALLSRALLGRGVELEPQFAAPYLASSLQDFWGRRWNLMVTQVLHPAVYLPVRSRWGTLAGVLAAFLVSGIMHEAMFYYLTLRRPTGEATCFFLLQGVCTAAEVAAKRALGRKGWKAVPRVVTAPLTLAFVWGTGLLLFFPPLLRDGATEELVVAESIAVLDAGRATVGKALALLHLT